MKKINLSWILITLMIAAFLIGYGKMNNDNKSFLNFGGQKAEETVQEAITFISETMLDGAEAVLVSFSDESGVYKFKMKVNEEEYDSYLTKDGKILFPSGISLVEPEESSEVAQGEKMTCEDINKILFSHIINRIKKSFSHGLYITGKRPASSYTCFRNAFPDNKSAIFKLVKYDSHFYHSLS